MKMDINQTINKCKDLYESTWSFNISKTDFKRNGRSLNYNFIIRKNISKDNEVHGVYIISNTESSEILYVGMSGQIKRLDNGDYDNCGYDIRKRLVSSRGKNNETEKDISSSDFFESKMKEKTIESITITIIQTNKDVSPTFLESQILQWIFSETKILPDWNKSF